MTVQATELTPYSTVVPFISALPEWMGPLDAQRVAGYQIYEQIYWSVPDTFRLQMRGSDADPIYIPTARTIVDTTNRYVARDFAFAVETDVGTDADQKVLHDSLTLLFRRERFWSKFAANKRFGMIRGDWCWHVIANDLKPPGSRITIEALDPGSYFPVFESDVKDGGDPDKIVAVHIVEQVQVGDDVFLKRQTYTKGQDPSTNDGSDTTIWNSIGYFDPKAWEDIRLNPVKVVKPPTQLNPLIKSIPVYHIRNFETPGDPFGSSEIRGVERVIAAINQAISDQELALALDGLGVFATDGGPPKDETGAITDWIMGPGSVVEHPPSSKFTRVSGVGSVQPVLDHLAYLSNSIKEATGTPDAAIGKVDVSIAESGISLILQLGPMLAKVSEREQVITDVHRQMFYDLSQMWLPAYEQISTPSVAVPIYGDTIPANKDKQVEEIFKMVDSGLVDSEWARQEIAKIRGYVFPQDIGTTVLNEQQERARATDPFAERMSGELQAAQNGQSNGQV
jgi:hypothetical protein